MNDNQKQLVNKYFHELAVLPQEDRSIIAEMLNEEFNMRRTGRSTRQIDGWVQDFFTKGYCDVVDHSSKLSGHNDVAEIWIERIIHRLNSEHMMDSSSIQIKGCRIINTWHRSNKQSNQ
ncbi:hypothetical protein CLV58_12550 [Spirosoma oryzae]|uniref:Uncharacterized protein n=1 Tax=Spirosoma oryzae TaxID=1469603 RepID=A0A2T0S8N4_9BACT|nr:hypothetical protein [Spirosoma oryzae]PRY29788.1 hypothetical protein CLV58_12550 [Spirosoma oryzae]